MDADNSPVYLLNDGDEWFVYVSTYSNWTLWVDGGPADVAPGTDNVQNRWFVTDHKPKKLELVGGPTRKLVEYRLPEGTSIDGLPRTLTPEEWRERFYDAKGDEVHDPRGNLYEAIHEDQEPEHKLLTTPPLVLEGRPKTNEDWSWVAQLPFELRERSEYRHLFPGYIAADFRVSLAKKLESLPYVDHCFSHKPGPLEVSVRVHYEPTVWWPKRNSNGRVKKVQGSRGYVNHRFEIRAPTRIEGPNLATAMAKWDREMRSFLEVVEEAAHVVPCGHCNGRGWNERPQPEPEPVAAATVRPEDDIPF